MPRPVDVATLAWVERDFDAARNRDRHHLVGLGGACLAPTGSCATVRTPDPTTRGGGACLALFTSQRWRGWSAISTPRGIVTDMTSSGGAGRAPSRPGPATRSELPSRPPACARHPSPCGLRSLAVRAALPSRRAES